MIVLVRSFSYTPHAVFGKEFLLHSTCWLYWAVFLSLCMLNWWEFCLTVALLELVLARTCRSLIQKQTQVLSFVQTKMQEQGLTGYSSVRLTSRASHRLGKCRLSWVWLGFGLLSALSECNACLGRDSHRHASSGFVSVQTDQTAQSWHDLVRTSVFPFTLIVAFSELILVRSFPYTPEGMFVEEFLLHSPSWF